MNKIYICDSDFLIGLINKDDLHHAKIIKILEGLLGTEFHLYCPVNILCEASAMLQRRLKKPKLALELINLIIAGGVRLISVSEKDMLDALKIYKPDGNKKDTLFDATCLVIARRLNADAIFSFEHYYRKNNFKTLVEF